MKSEVIVHRIVKQKKTEQDYIEKHTHPFFHYIYVLSGIGKINIADKPFTAKSGNLLMIVPGMEHEIFGVDEFLSFDVKFQCGEVLTKKLRAVGNFIECVSDYEDYLFKDMFNEGICAEFGYQEIINAKMTEILFYILRRCREGGELARQKYITQHYVHAANGVKAQKIMLALDYIDAHPEQPLKNEQLAALCGYTESYFSTYFKECMNCTPNKYINLKRTEMAKSLMMTTDLNITQISERLGFESIHYFSRVFKKILGITPMLYLNRSKMKLDIGLNIVKDSVYTPQGEYEIPMKAKKSEPE